MSPSNPIASGLVRVRDMDDAVVGAGFLIAIRTVVTCAHVAALALRVSEQDLLSCEEPLTVDFALLPGASAARLPARVVSLPALPESAGVVSDVAVLKLEGDAPRGAAPLPLSGDRRVQRHPFVTFGFPSFSPDDNGDWAEGVIEDVGSAGLLQIRGTSRQGRRVQRGFSGAPVWDAETGQVAGMVVKADFAGDDRVAYAIPSWDLSATLADKSGAPRCPYRGLESFREGDAEFFFGRDEFVARLVMRVRERSMLAVAGQSGAGKSSVLAAGLAAHYLASPEWHVARMRPGRHPFRELAHAILPVLEPGLSPVERLEKAGVLAGIIREEGLKACLADGPGDGRHSLLIIDQFEELFTISEAADVGGFIDTIVRSAEDYAASQVGKFCIVLAMRTEFLDAALEHPGLADAINPVEVLGGMTADQLRQVIEDPVRGSGVEFADGLAERILYDAPNNAQLPLVEFLLASLWTNRDNLQMTHSVYQDLGGVGGALAKHAEIVFTGLAHQDQGRAKGVLMRLVTARAEDTPVTCRVAGSSEFDAESWRLVRHLADRRLLLLAQDLTGNLTVQVTHEALTTKWARFARWITDDRSRLAVTGEVRDAAGRWIARKRDPRWLLTGEALAEAAAWTENPLGADPVTLEFVAWSLASGTDTSEFRGELARRVFQLSERTDSVALRVACLKKATWASIANFEPFIAFSYWRQLWQYEDAMRDAVVGGQAREWKDAANTIWLISMETVPIIGIWLLSWFGIASLVGEAINYHHGYQAIAMGAALSVVLIVFWYARRAFRHPVLVLPLLLAASMIIAGVPFWRKPTSPAWMTPLRWESTYLAITTVLSAALFFFLGRRYRLARRRRILG
jgi:Trypsin-like peptidase domain